MSPVSPSKYFSHKAIGLFSAVLIAIGPTFSYAGRGLTQGRGAAAGPTEGISHTQQWVTFGAGSQQASSLPSDHTNASTSHIGDISFAFHPPRDLKPNGVSNFVPVSPQVVGPALEPAAEDIVTLSADGVAAARPAPLAEFLQIHKGIPGAPGEEALPELLGDGSRGALPVLEDLQQVADSGRDVQNAGLLDGQARDVGAPFDGYGSVPAELRGEISTVNKTLLVVGTKEDRPWVLHWAKRAAESLRLDLLLLDDPNHRKHSEGVVSDTHFIKSPASVLDHSSQAMEEIADRVVNLSAQTPIHGVVTFLNPYALLAAKLVDRLNDAYKATRRPYKVLGNPYHVVETAHTKHMARERLATSGITVPSRVVNDAKEVRSAFRDLSRKGQYKVVLKPIRGGGSTLVRVGIGSEDEAVRRFQRIRRKLRESASDHWHMFDQDPGILMEQEVQGWVIGGRYVPPWEGDVEQVYQNGAAEFSLIIDNPPVRPPFPTELGSTFPSQLGTVQHGIRLAAQEAASALGVMFGNVHTEVMYGSNGFVIVEVNMRPGGDLIAQLVYLLTKINLYEAGIGSIFGHKVPSFEGQAPFVIEERYAIPAASGKIEHIEGLSKHPMMSRHDHDIGPYLKQPGDYLVRPLKKEGDQVTREDWIFHVMGIGSNYGHAFSLVRKALKSVSIKIRTRNGKIVSQRGSRGHLKTIYPDALGLGSNGRDSK